LSLYALGGVVAWNGTKQYTSATKAYGATSAASVYGKLDDERVVAWGLRIRNVQPPGSATGMIEVAQVPAGIYAPNPTVLDNIAPTDAGFVGLALNDLPFSGTQWSTLLNLPDSDEYAVQELMASDILAVGKFCSPDYLKFRHANGSAAYNGASSLSDQVEYTTAGVINTNGTSNQATNDLSGRTAIVVRLRGFPVSTMALDVEIVYHLEGTPISDVSGLATGAKISLAISPVALSQMVSEVNRRPGSMMIAPWIAHQAKNVYKGMSDVVSSRLGLGAATPKTKSAARLAGRGLTAGAIYSLMGTLLAGTAGYAGGKVIKAVRNHNTKKQTLARRVQFKGLI